MKKILLLGGTGYIGSSLYLYLKNRYFVDTVDLEWYGNFVNPDNIKDDFKNLSKEKINKYDVIILLAAHSSVKMCENNYVSALKNNVLNFVELIEKINQEQILIYASSSSVYGDTNLQKVNENYKFFEPNNFYDLTKHEADLYSSIINKKLFGLRFGTVNGFSKNLRNDIMINAMFFNGKKEKTVYCYNKDIYRPILGLQDLCKSIEKIILYGNFENKGIYNLASFNLTAGQIAQRVASKINAQLKICVSPPNNITNIKLQQKAYNFSIDTKKFENIFDFSFSESVESIVDSLEQNISPNKMSRLDAKLY